MCKVIDKFISNGVRKGPELFNDSTVESLRKMIEPTSYNSKQNFSKIIDKFARKGHEKTIIFQLFYSQRLAEIQSKVVVHLQLFRNNLKVKYVTHDLRMQLPALAKISLPVPTIS